MNVQVELREVDASNREAVEAVQVAADQRAYLDTPDLAPFLLTAPEHPTFASCGVFAAGEVVGFVSFGCEPEEVVLERLRREIVGLECVGLSYKPANVAASELYRRMGFVADSQPDERGEINAWLSVGGTMSDEARLRALVSQETNRFWNHLGIVIEAVDEGFVRLRLPMQPEFGTYRREGVMHGGVIASLIDSGASAVLTLQAADEPAWTGTVSTDLSVSFLAAATSDLVADARVVRAGRRMAWVQVDVRDASDALVAVGRVTVAIRRE